MLIFKLLDSQDVMKDRDTLIELMEIILCENIPQNYPKTLAENYVDKIPGYIADGSAIVSGAYINDKLMGFCWGYELNIFDEKRLHIDMIGVNKDCQKQGIASGLFEIQKDVAKERNIKIIEAMTTKSNTNSYQWFLRQGFCDERVKVMMNLEDEA